MELRGSSLVRERVCEQAHEPSRRDEPGKVQGHELSRRGEPALVRAPFRRGALGMTPSSHDDDAPYARDRERECERVC